MTQHDPSALSRMFQLARATQSIWEPDELGALWQHQLNAPIEFDLTQFGGFLPFDSIEFRHGAEPCLGTFGELFHHASPPVELLEATKQFAKACRGGDGSLPDEIATMLYIIAIVVAGTRSSRPISQLDDSALRYALDWALAQPWLDPRSRGLLEDGYRLISDPL